MPRTAQPPQIDTGATHSPAKRPGTHKSRPRPPTVHKHALRLPPSSQGTQRKKLPLREKARSLSIMGTTDKDITTIHLPTLKPATLRRWRANDPEWSLIFARLKPHEVGGRPRKIDKERREREQASTTTLLEATLPAISSRNAIRAANEADRALAKVEKRKTPLPISTWTEYKQAFSVLRTACGDDNTQGAQVQVNIWGNPGEASSGVARAFRDVTAKAAPAQPAIAQ